MRHRITARRKRESPNEIARFQDLETPNLAIQNLPPRRKATRLQTLGRSSRPTNEASQSDQRTPTRKADQDQHADNILRIVVGKTNSVQIPHIVLSRLPYEELGQTPSVTLLGPMQVKRGMWWPARCRPPKQPCSRHLACPPLLLGGRVRPWIRLEEPRNGNLVVRQRHAVTVVTAVVALSRL
jgi:hypothetical protein